MNNRLVQGAGILLSLWLALSPLFPVTAENSPDVLQALDFPALFEEEKVPDDSVSREGTLETTLSEYPDVSLREVFTLAEKLEEDRWYFTRDQALRDKRSLLLRYDMLTRRLRLELTVDAGKAVWPDVLTPELACTTPAFIGGIFKDSAPQEILNRLDNVQLAYVEVKPEDVQAYEDLLTQSGYEPRKAEDNSTEYVKNLNFVRLLYHARRERLEITVGRYLTYFVPLPPWPDPLPQQLKRALPTVAARQSVDIVQAGYLATVTDISLFALYRFAHSAQQHYGWSALQNDAVMTHTGLQVQLAFLAWNTDAHRLLFLLEGDAAVLFPAPAP